MTTIQARRWLSNKDAAIYLGCSPTFLNQDRLSGIHGIPFAKMGRVIRYDVRDLDRWLEQQKVRAFPTAHDE